MAEAPKNLILVAEGLRFPEGPVALADGSVIVSEIERGVITRIAADGTKTRVAAPGGGPNGNAIGPDGYLYNCNGGGFSWSETDGLLLAGKRAPDYAGGRIDRIDLATGRVTTLYRATADGIALSAPNDLVFDTQGGFWFTDYGAQSEEAHAFGGIFYAKADGSFITRVVSGIFGSNGIGLSPDGRTLYVAQTIERQLLAFDIVAPGQLAPLTPFPGRVLYSFGGRSYLDSLKVDSAGNVLVGVLMDKIIAVISPKGELLERIDVPDIIPANLCFGGGDLRTMFMTASSTGKLFQTTATRPGLRLAFQSL